MWHLTNPTAISVPAGQVTGPSLAAQAECLQTMRATWRTPTTESHLALSLLSVSKGLLHPVWVMPMLTPENHGAGWHSGLLALVAGVILLAILCTIGLPPLEVVTGVTCWTKSSSVLVCFASWTRPFQKPPLYLNDSVIIWTWVFGRNFLENEQF